MNHKSLLFLASGNGGTLKFIHHAIAQLRLPLTISAVITDRECGALEFARRVGLPAHRIRYTRQVPEALQQLLRTLAPDAVVTNIHKIIDAGTLGLLPERFVNLHYSLLPAFKGYIGMETVEQARLLNVTVVGATCHAVDEQVDNGRCLAQFAVGVNWQQDSTAQIYDLVFRGACLTLLQGLLAQLALPTPAAATATWQQHGHTLLFAPALTVDVARLDEEFWQRVQQS